MEIHHLLMFGGYWYSASGSVKHLICHVTLKNHVTESSCNSLTGSSSLCVTTLPSLVAISIAIVEIYGFLLVT